ncbi:hypothetical protein [Eudoraea chungangensis]|uniref:hypothetical protein n=1 Tax=Eudoraea chungangensis TaxID=1481905 RepID=UPI0023EC9711|nr:hypothetical protein [Eudoraea chungangensis]
MTILVNSILGITLSFLTVENPKSDSAQSSLTDAPIHKSVTYSAQQRAYEILSNKCNVCHAYRNHRRVFTEENMNLWANDVYQQVFIKKRMPKGKKIKLSSIEYQDLLTWISSLKNN